MIKKIKITKLTITSQTWGTATFITIQILSACPRLFDSDINFKL